MAQLRRAILALAACVIATVPAAASPGTHVFAGAGLVQEGLSAADAVPVAATFVEGAGGAIAFAGAPDPILCAVVIHPNGGGHELFAETAGGWAVHIVDRGPGADQAGRAPGDGSCATREMPLRWPVIAGDFTAASPPQPPNPPGVPCISTPLGLLCLL